MQQQAKKAYFVLAAFVSCAAAEFKAAKAAKAAAEAAQAGL